MGTDEIATRTDVEFKLYKRRWVIMGLFMLYAINGAVQWVQFTIISDLVTKFYEVTSTQVELTSTIFMLTSVLLIIPSLCVMNKLGVRNTMIVGAIGVAIGTWIKVFSVAPDRFQLVLIGQGFEAVFQILTFGLAARFTAIWFGANEISIAGALALFGDQLGTALAFYIPPVFVENGPLRVIGEGLQKMHYWIAGSSTIVLILIILFFKDHPTLPPSAAQAKQRQVQNENVLTVLKSIFTKPSFLLIIFSYGINIGSFNALATLLNPILLANFPGHTKDAGRIGFVMMLSGMFSSLVVGRILDKTRLFKENAVFLTIGSACTMLAFTWSLKSNNILFVYLVVILLGFFILSYYATGFQMGIEVTYPVSEEISSTMIVLSTQIHGFIITSVLGYVIKAYGDFAICNVLTATFTLSALFAILIPKNLKRQNVEKEAHKFKEEETKEFI